METSNFYCYCAITHDVKCIYSTDSREYWKHSQSHEVFEIVAVEKTSIRLPFKILLQQKKSEFLIPNQRTMAYIYNDVFS